MNFNVIYIFACFSLSLSRPLALSLRFLISQTEEPNSATSALLATYVFCVTHLMTQNSTTKRCLPKTPPLILPLEITPSVRSQKTFNPS